MFLSQLPRRRAAVPREAGVSSPPARPWDERGLRGGVQVWHVRRSPGAYWVIRGSHRTFWFIVWGLALPYRSGNISGNKIKCGENYLLGRRTRDNLRLTLSDAVWHLLTLHVEKLTALIEPVQWQDALNHGCKAFSRAKDSPWIHPLSVMICHWFVVYGLFVCTWMKWQSMLQPSH